MCCFGQNQVLHQLVSKSFERALQSISSQPCYFFHTHKLEVNLIPGGVCINQISLLEYFFHG
jgi:hypothetical protein